MTSISSTISSVLNAYYGNLSSKLSSTDTTSSTDSTSSTDDSTTTKKTVSYSDSTSVGLYLNSVSSDKADAKTIFSDLSLDMGGDGKTITKDQLDSYITKAQNGDISIPDEELSALTTLQKNWDTISAGGDSISYANVSAAGYKDTLLSMVPDKSSNTIDMSSDYNDSLAKVENTLISADLGTSTDSSSSTDSYSSMLKTLLTAMSLRVSTKSSRDR